jgi:hypothetical protein
VITLPNLNPATGPLSVARSQQRRRGDDDGRVTVIRYRRWAGGRWRTGILRAANRAGPGEFAAVVTNRRRSSTRTLSTARWQLQVCHHGRWVALRHWAFATAELFTIQPEDTRIRIRRTDAGGSGGRGR